MLPHELQAGNCRICFVFLIEIDTKIQDNPFSIKLFFLAFYSRSVSIEYDSLHWGQKCFVYEVKCQCLDAGFSANKNSFHQTFHIFKMKAHFEKEPHFGNESSPRANISAPSVFCSYFLQEDSVRTLLKDA